MTKHEENKYKEDVKQASTIIAVVSIIGLTICFIYSLSKEAQIPLFLYAIFGGGILGTENVLRIFKTIFRVGNNNDEK